MSTEERKRATITGMRAKIIVNAAKQRSGGKPVSMVDIEKAWNEARAQRDVATSGFWSSSVDAVDAISEQRQTGTTDSDMKRARDMYGVNAPDYQVTLTANILSQQRKEAWDAKINKAAERSDLTALKQRAETATDQATLQKISESVSVWSKNQGGFDIWQNINDAKRMEVERLIKARSAYLEKKGGAQKP
jgi:hypothetical protein